MKPSSTETKALPVAHHLVAGFEFLLLALTVTGHERPGVCIFCCLPIKKRLIGKLSFAIVLAMTAEARNLAWTAALPGGSQSSHRVGARQRGHNRVPSYATVLNEHC